MTMPGISRFSLVFLILLAGCYDLDVADSDANAKIEPATANVEQQNQDRTEDSGADNSKPDGPLNPFAPEESSDDDEADKDPGALAQEGHRLIRNQELIKTTRQRVFLLVQACKSYRLNHQEFPEKLKDLFEAPGGDDKDWGGPFTVDTNLNDEFGTEFRYAVDEENGKVRITSAGPDKELDTDDDIDSY